jgi:tripartite-type tricarboxylate transporter receptor subunit TctC
MKMKLLAAFVAFSTLAHAQEWPSRLPTMIVPFPAGGPVDVLGRILGQAIGDVIGKSVVIENVTGAGGMTGSLRVSQGNPDGHLFLLGSMGTHAINQTLYKRPLYNAATDFAHVSLIADAPLVLTVRKDLPVSNLEEFIAYAKANQKTMQFGSAGTGTSTHIGGVLFNQAIGVEVQHIPYRGGGPALLDLIAGRIDYICNIISTAVPAIEAGQVKAIATLALKRSAVLPNVPTAHELGLKDFEAYTWNAVFMPKAATPEMVGRLNAAVNKAVENPVVVGKLATLGLYPVAPERRTPAYLQKFVESEIKKWEGPIRASGAVGE